MAWFLCLDCGNVYKKKLKGFLNCPKCNSPYVAYLGPDSMTEDELREEIEKAIKEYKEKFLPR